jgi:hypothetical protein
MPQLSKKNPKEGMEEEAPNILCEGFQRHCFLITQNSYHLNKRLLISPYFSIVLPLQLGHVCFYITIGQPQAPS